MELSIFAGHCKQRANGVIVFSSGSWISNCIKLLRWNLRNGHNTGTFKLLLLFMMKTKLWTEVIA